MVCADTTLLRNSCNQATNLQQKGLPRPQGEKLAREGHQAARERAEVKVFRGKVNINIVVPDQKGSLG